MKYLYYTQQNYEIYAYFRIEQTNCIVVIFKRNRDWAPWGYAWGYDVNTGSWCQGHYDYETYMNALEDMEEHYEGNIHWLHNDEIKGL